MRTAFFVIAFLAAAPAAHAQSSIPRDGRDGRQLGMELYQYPRRSRGHHAGARPRRRDVLGNGRGRRPKLSGSLRAAAAGVRRRRMTPDWADC
jgi:hypothetical protein